MIILHRLLIYIIILIQIYGINTQYTLAKPSLATIIAPLMQNVVSIYAVKYKNKTNYSKIILLQKMLPSSKSSNSFEQPSASYSSNKISLSSQSMSLGSGLIISKSGYIVTSGHLICNSDKIYVKLFDDSEFIAKVIGHDLKTDIALLKINIQRSLLPAVFGDSRKVRVGDLVIAIGNPLGFSGTVTTGIISSKCRHFGLDQGTIIDGFLQTDAAINIGNSGGPLYDLNGKVIGMNTSILDINNGVNIGIGFAIPSNTVQYVISQLKEKRKINCAMLLDITTQEVTKKLVDAFSLSYVSYGVLVTNVKDTGTGAKAGLKTGDVIVEFNGIPVVSPRMLQQIIDDNDTNTGDTIMKFSVIRDSIPMTFITTKKYYSS